MCAAWPLSSNTQAECAATCFFWGRLVAEVPKFFQPAVVNAPDEQLWPVMEAMGTFSQSVMNIAESVSYASLSMFTHETTELLYPGAANK